MIKKYTAAQMDGIRTTCELFSERKFEMCALINNLNEMRDALELEIEWAKRCHHHSTRMIAFADKDFDASTKISIENDSTAEYINELQELLDILESVHNSGNFRILLQGIPHS